MSASAVFRTGYLIAIAALFGGGLARVPALAVIGGVLLVITLVANVTIGFGRARQVCPECAERVPAEAKVCSHCGHRLK